MQKSCWYCHRPLSLFKSFKGELFCDSDHEKLYLNEQFKRVQEPFSPKAVAPKAPPEPPPQPAPPAPVSEPVRIEPVEPVYAEPVYAEPVYAEPVREPELVPEPVAEIEPAEIKPAEIKVEAVPEPVLPVAVAPPLPKVEPLRTRDHRDAGTEPPSAPLFPWPVTVCQGTWHTPVPDAHVDLIPQRTNPTHTEPVALKTTLPAAAAVDAATISAHEAARPAPVSGEAAIVLPALVKPRMGENSRLAVAREDLPTATSVATPVRASGVAPPRITPEAPETLKPERLDPRVFDQTLFDPNQIRPELGYGSASRLQLRPSHPAAVSRAIPQGLPAGFSETPLSKQVPRMLSFGVAPQPELTPALSSQLNPVVSSETGPSIVSADSLPSQIEVRIPEAAAPDANQKSSAPAAGAIQKDLRALDGSESSLPSKNALPSHIAVRIPHATPGADWHLNWTGTPGTFVTAFRIDQKETAHDSLESLLETSLQLTLISMATLGNASVDRATVALVRAAFMDAVRIEPSQYRVDGAVPERPISTQPPMPQPRFAANLASASPALAESYAAVPEVSTCANSPVSVSQTLSDHVPAARASTQLEFANSLAPVSHLGESSVARLGPVESPWKSARNVAPGAIRAAEWAATSVSAMQLPPSVSGTVALAAGTWKNAELSIAASTTADLLSASAQIAKSLDSRRPESVGNPGCPALRTGMVALRLNSIDGIVTALDALEQLRRVSQTGLPAAAIFVGHAALGVGSTLAISAAVPSAYNAPEFTHSQKPRRAVSASLLGMPAARRPHRDLSPIQGQASEIAISCANSGPVPDFDSALPLIVPATNQIAAIRFRASSPALSENPAILTFAPIAGDVPSAARLAQPRPRRHSPISLLVFPGVQMAKRPESLATEPEVPAVTLS